MAEDKSLVAAIQRLVAARMKGSWQSPMLIRFSDTGEYRAVPQPHLTNISWSDRNRAREVILGPDWEVDDLICLGQEHGVEEAIGKIVEVKKEPVKLDDEAADSKVAKPDVRHGRPDLGYTYMTDEERAAFEAMGKEADKAMKEEK